MSFPSKIEGILFATAKPLSYRKLAETLEVSEEVVKEAVEALKAARNREDSGIHLLDQNGGVQLVTNPLHNDLLGQFVKVDLGRELTRPSLETLTIIAYRGPLTKPEIELIRGVNCSLILRNLLMRDLIIEKMDKEKLQPVYAVSHTFLRHLGLTSVRDLPEYESFSENDDIARLLGGPTGDV